ncbi:hypothetical protein [Nisaea sp.]|uniref:hypothetical protein n=1 Tax=Nisaea sp. TaxID=2024842 RepID=UPI0032EF46E4
MNGGSGNSEEKDFGCLSFPEINLSIKFYIYYVLAFMVSVYFLVNFSGAIKIFSIASIVLLIFISLANSKEKEESGNYFDVEGAVFHNSISSRRILKSGIVYYFYAPSVFVLFFVLLELLLSLKFKLTGVNVNFPYLGFLDLNSNLIIDYNDVIIVFIFFFLSIVFVGLAFVIKYSIFHFKIYNRHFKLEFWNNIRHSAVLSVFLIVIFIALNVSMSNLKSKKFLQYGDVGLVDFRLIWCVLIVYFLSYFSFLVVSHVMLSAFLWFSRR